MVYADKCVLGRKALVATIKSELHLPKDATTAPDSHYRCPRCLGSERSSGRIAVGDSKSIAKWMKQ
jgi:hypothetical protein